MSSMELKTERSATVFEKVIVSVFYAASSIAIMMLNKVVLTSYNFPSSNFIALLQCIVTLLVLLFQKLILRSADFPLPIATYVGPLEFRFYTESMQLAWRHFQSIMPLPLFFLLNTVTGLSATKELNMPMFVLLRRFSILMTLGLEMYLLRKRFHQYIFTSVFLMLLGALVAACGDLQWHLYGYLVILGNDLFTALQGVVLRQKMDLIGKPPKEEIKETRAVTVAVPPSQTGDTCSKDLSIKVTSPVQPLSMQGLMFYNNLFALPLILIMLCCLPSSPSKHAAHEPSTTTEWGRIMHEFDTWRSPVFLVCLFGTSCFGFILNYSYFLCSKLTSPLTCTVIGCLKNVFTTYLGMIFKDYQFTMLNFIGMNISVAGSLLYNYAEFSKKKELPVSPEEKEREKTSELQQHKRTASHTVVL